MAGNKMFYSFVMALSGRREALLKIEREGRTESEIVSGVGSGSPTAAAANGNRLHRDRF